MDAVGAIGPARAPAPAGDYESALDAHQALLPRITASMVARGSIIGNEPIRRTCPRFWSGGLPLN
jgi:hypothetical protein